MLLSPEGEWRLYYGRDNSREYEGREEQFIALEEGHLTALRQLVAAYPRYTRLENLKLEGMEAKVGGGGCNDSFIVLRRKYSRSNLVNEHPCGSSDECTAVFENCQQETDYWVLVCQGTRVQGVGLVG